MADKAPPNEPFNWTMAGITAKPGTTMSVVYGADVKAVLPLSAAITVGNKLDLLFDPSSLINLIPGVAGALTPAGALKGMIFGRNEFVFGSKTEYCLNRKTGVQFDGKDDVNVDKEDQVFLNPMIQAANILALLEMLIFGGAGAAINVGGGVGQGFAVATGGIIVPAYVGVVVCLAIHTACTKKKIKETAIAVAKWTKAGALYVLKGLGKLLVILGKILIVLIQLAVLSAIIWVPLLLRSLGKMG